MFVRSKSDREGPTKESLDIRACGVYVSWARFLVHDAPKKEANGDYGSPNAKDLGLLGALMECSEEVTLIGIIFSSEQWGVCAQDDIQLVEKKDTV